MRHFALNTKAQPGKYISLISAVVEYFAHQKRKKNTVIAINMSFFNKMLSVILV